MTVSIISEKDLAKNNVPEKGNTAAVEPAAAAQEVSVSENDKLENETPATLAAEINQITNQTRRFVLDAVIEIGRLLCAAKAMLPPGQWETWLKDSIDYSLNSAQNYMRLYKQYGDPQGGLWGARVANPIIGQLEYTKALALLSLPAEDREEFAHKIIDDNLSNRELAAAIADKKSADEARLRAEAEAEAARKRWEQEEKLRKENDKAAAKLDVKIMKLEEKLKKAQGSATSEKTINDLKSALAQSKESANAMAAEYERELAKLKAENASKPIDTTAVDADQVLANHFEAYFESTKASFNGLLASVNGMHDANNRRKYAGALRKFLGALQSRVEQNN